MKNKLTPKEKGLALVSTVHDVGDGCYTVAGEDLPHLVSPAQEGQGPTCTCADWVYRHSTQPYYRCKHAWAVRLFLEQRLAAQRTPRPRSIKQSMYQMGAHLKREEGRRPQGVTLQ